MTAKPQKKRRGGWVRWLIGGILLVMLFLCAQLAVLYVQSAVYDYQYYMSDELKDAALHLEVALREEPADPVAAIVDEMRAYFAGHDISNNPLNTYDSKSAHFDFTVTANGQEALIFAEDLASGFTADVSVQVDITAREMGRGLSVGVYESYREGLGAEDRMASLLRFSAGGADFVLRVSLPSREPLLRTLPTILGIALAVAALVLLLFFFLRQQQKQLVDQAVRSAKRTQLVLDHLQTSVHVTRPETGEMLFANQVLRDTYGLDEECLDKRCWETLREGMRERCQYCPLYQLQGDPTSAVVWEYHDGVTGRAYRKTDYLIEWDDNSTVLMEHSMDVTDELGALRRMQRQVAQQKLLSHLSIEVATHLEGDNHQLYSDMLGEIGVFLDVDRVWVMHLGQDHTPGETRMFYLYEWHQEQLRPLSYHVPFVRLQPHWIEEQTRIQAQVVQLPQDLPVIDTMPYEQMRLYSNAYIVLTEGGQPWGVLCLSMQERTREWTEEDLELVRTFSGILSNAIQNALVQNRLHDTQRTLRSILENIPLGVYWKDASSRYIGCNQSFKRLLGVTEASIEGKSDFDLFPREYAEDYYATDQIAIQSGDIYEDFVRSVANEQGEKRWLRRKKLVVWQEDGQVAFILGIVEDITLQKQAEMKRDESLSVLSAAMENYPGILWSLDADHRVALMGGTGLIGAEQVDYQNAVGRTLEEVYARIPELVSRTLATYGQGAQTFSIAYDGRTYNFFTSQVLDGEGRVTGIVATGLDMTQEMALRQDLEDAIIRAENASNAKSDFLSRMSHEIRTPMNVIIGMCRMAMRASDPAKAKHSLMQIDASAKHLLSLINDILDMSKIEANKMELHNEPFDFEKMLMDVCASVQVRAGERHQTLQVLMARGMPHNFEGDEMRLSQVVTNLFTNAIKFSPDGGNIVLSVKPLEEEDGILTLETRVRDHGIGMTQEQIDKLFVSFEQADGGIARKYGGTGLGLAICKSIVTMMDGDIWVESEYGKGSTFIFTVKLKLAPEQTRREASRDLREENLRTLVVDDSIETCDYIADIMEGFGIQCDKALSGAQALERVRAANEENRPYDIVFVDWQMPDLDGIDTIRKMRELEGHQVPVIMISSADLSQIEDEAKGLGVKYFVPKPLFPSDLFNVVHTILGLGSVPAPDDGLPKVASTPDLSGHVVLLAEDMEFNREVAIGILEETGCEVDEAINGLEAVELFRKAPMRYSCILMDMQMPGMDGLEATRAIRALKGEPWAQKIPIIAMTANVFRDDIEKCLEAGMDDHIGKPISDTVLYEKLAFYLHSVDTRRREMEAQAAQEADQLAAASINPALFQPYLNVEGALSRLRDNKKLLATLLSSFARNTKFAQLQQQVAEGSLAEAAATAHALKGIAGNIELTALYEQITALEETLKTDTPPADGIMQTLAQTYQKTLDIIPAATKYLGNQ